MVIKIFFNTNIDLLEHKTTENPKTLLQCAVIAITDKFVLVFFVFHLNLLATRFY